MGKRILNIAIVVPKFPVLSETFIYNQALALIQRGHNVTILAFHSGEESIRHEVVDKLFDKAKIIFFPKDKRQRLTSYLLRFIKKKIENVPFTTVNRSEELQWHRVVQFYSSISTDAWLQSLPAFDIFHAHHGPSAIPIAKSLKTLKKDTPPLIVSFHGNDISPDRLTKSKALYKNVFSVSTFIIANTPYLADLLYETDVDKSKVKIIPVGLDINKFVSNSLSINRYQYDPFKIIFCGRLIRIKGPEYAVLTLGWLKDKLGMNNIELTIVGSGPLEKELKQIVKKSELEEQVRFAGAVSQEELINLLKNAHLFFLPGVADPITGRAETQGLVIQEAQAMGLPVLISDAGGMRYGMIPNVTGYCVSQKNIVEYADRIRQLYHDEVLRLKMGAAAREFAAQHYNIMVISEQLEKVYFDSICELRNHSEK